MNNGLPLLSRLVWLPIAGGVALLALGERSIALGRWLALVVESAFDIWSPWLAHKCKV